MQKYLPKLFLLLAFIIVTLVFIGIEISRTVNTPNSLQAPVTIELNRGATIRTLARQLEDHEILEYPELLIVWARLNGLATRLQAGEYTLQPGSTISELTYNMVAGRVRQYALTLVEGWTFRQFMKAVDQHEAIDHTLHNLSDDRIMTALGFEGEHPEGRFFPETYFIHKNITDVEVLLRAHNLMTQNLRRLWDSRDQGLPFKNSYEALILASIVEKESAVPQERNVIAGVFINRLRKNMRLQTDPTVIYGLGDSYDGDIRYRDLRTDTPYNTYTRKGLPPTPIAMPGLEAIEAVMHPAPTDYLYFVAMNDASGRHVFSSTLEQHEKAVDKHQRGR